MSDIYRQIPGGVEVTFELPPNVSAAELVYIFAEARRTIFKDTISYVSTLDAVAQASERSACIFQSFTALQDILGRYEAIVRKRWLKKTQTQRKELLLKAWPAIPTTHRPDLQAYRRENADRGKRGTCFRDYYMWPHINLEDLITGSTLLRLLNSRGRHHPSVFASMDLESTRLGEFGKWPMTVIRPHDKDTGGYMVNLHGKMPGEYGLVEKVQSMTIEEMIESNYFDGNSGLRVLEVQKHILEFLV